MTDLHGSWWTSAVLYVERSNYLFVQKFRRAVAPPSEKRSYCVMLISICSVLINDSSISIEFTENKITVTVEISESHSLWSYLLKQN